MTQCPALADGSSSHPNNAAYAFSKETILGIDFTGLSLLDHPNG
jgi:hypothetical protein